MQHALVGDIGGTKTVLALLRLGDAGQHQILSTKRFVSGEHDGLLPLAREFLRESAPASSPVRVDAASFGIAGPVLGRTCQATNLPWHIDADVLGHGLDAPVSLLNDFRAVAMGLSSLRQEDVLVLNEGARDPDGPCAVIGAGTGLGQAIVMNTPEGPRVIDTEGGHTDFAPRNELEVLLLRWLWQRVGRVSVERAVSGQGLCALYDFLVSQEHAAESPEVHRQMAHRDRGEVIGEHGLAGTDDACVRALNWFVSLYGAEAGNFALKTLPTGGLYVAGGIAPKIIEKLRDGNFMRAFLAKGRMSNVLARIPVYVVLEPRVGLWGAALAARELLR